MTIAAGGERGALAFVIDDDEDDEAKVGAVLSLVVGDEAAGVKCPDGDEDNEVDVRRARAPLGDVPGEGLLASRTRRWPVAS